MFCGNTDNFSDPLIQCKKTVGSSEQLGFSLGNNLKAYIKLNLHSIIH